MMRQGTRVAKKLAAVPGRERPPNRRDGYTEVIRWHGESEWTVTVNLNDRGRAIEVFIGNTKPGGFVGIWAHDSCILLSMLLQHGAKARELRGSFAPSHQFGAAEPSFIAALITHTAAVEAREGKQHRASHRALAKLGVVAG